MDRQFTTQDSRLNKKKGQHYIGMYKWLIG